jgi:hypothetical protein
MISKAASSTRMSVQVMWCSRVRAAWPSRELRAAHVHRHEPGEHRLGPLALEAHRRPGVGLVGERGALGRDAGPSDHRLPGSGPDDSGRAAGPAVRRGKGPADSLKRGRHGRVRPAKGATEVIASGRTSDSVTEPAVSGSSPAQGESATSLATKPPSLGVEGHGGRHLAERLDLRRWSTMRTRSPCRARPALRNPSASVAPSVGEKPTEVT